MTAIRYPGATFIGPTVNRTDGAMSTVYGIALHIQQGTEAGSEAWFNNPAAQASSHLLNPKTGPLRQMVDFDDKAWAEVAGNAHWISIENEGYPGDSLTPSQVQNIADFYRWAHAEFGIPYQSTDDPNGRGLGWHGMGGAAWGGHYDCPGEPIKAQRAQIIALAQGGTSPAPQPAPKPVVLVPYPGHLLSFNPNVFSRDVQTFQTRMLDRGWTSIGSADGKFGPKTLAVVKAFQKEKGLVQDGIVGEKTWTAAFRTDNVTP
jgi:hypothetical protein